MATPLENLSREELIAEVKRLQQCSDSVRLEHELEVHREELHGQLEQLRSTQTLLEQSRDEYAALYDFAPVTYLTLTGAGIIESINLTGCALLALDRKTILGLPMAGFVADVQRAGLLEHLRLCRQSSREQIATELTLKTRSDNEIPALVVSRRATADTFRTVIFDRTEQLRLDETIRQLNASLEDRVKGRTEELQKTNARLTKEIEQRIEAEDALTESHRRKDEFLAMLGHELRNPLSPIRNAAALVKLIGKEREELVQMSEIIERQVGHMSRIVDDLLDVSRISRGKIRLVKEPVELGAVVRDAIDDMQRFLTEGALTLTSQLFDGELWVHGDAVRLSQAVGNLLHNACKFTGSGGSIDVCLEYVRSEDQAEVRIRDTGIGIDPQTAANLFTPFYQGQSTLDRSRGGLGLGLALVHGLIHMHGGCVSVHSEGLGRGACFTIRLPLVPSPTPQDRKTETSPPKVQSLRILVIDDQRDTVFTLQRVLSKLGHEVFAATNGEDGLQVAKEKLPHVIFSDIGLPGISGYDVARMIRSDKQLSPRLLVAITGYGREEDRQAAMSAGFDRHLVKPIAVSEVTKLLQNI